MRRRERPRGGAIADDTIESRAREHGEISRLLPWYVNETLGEEQTRRVQGHLTSCIPCRRDVEDLIVLSGLLEEREETPSSPAAGFSRLLAKLDGEPGSPRLAPEPGQRIPAGARLGLLAQAAAILLLLGALVWPGRGGGPEAVFRTLAGPPASRVADGGVLLRALFSDSTPEAEIRGALRAIGGQLVAGPSELGLYTVLVRDVRTRQEADELLELLRSTPGIRFAELAAGQELPARDPG